MADPLIDAAAQGAATGGIGGVLGSLVAFFAVTKNFAKPEDVTQVKVACVAEINVCKLACERDIANLRAEIAEKYMTREAVQPLMDELLYIRERVDDMADRR